MIEKKTTTTMTVDQPASVGRFEWHPDFQGKSVSEVRTTLTNELASDQRAYALALEGAEEHENAALATVLDLEKKWGTYDLDWAAADPSLLASQIVAFEQERERRQELIPFATYRERAEPMTGSSATSSTRGTGSARATPMLPLPVLAIAIAVLVLLVIVLVVQ
jgi:DNA segregation ATPase FtsK/SpoIIIE-like protein